LLQHNLSEATSFTDDTSPNLQSAKKRNVSIGAKVRRETPLDWFYDLINLCRNVTKLSLPPDTTVSAYIP
jgi:hypothetical protein